MHWFHIWFCWFIISSHKVNFKWGGSDIDSFDWIKNKKVSINLINEKDNTCCQYTIKIALRHAEIEKLLEEWQKLIHSLLMILCSHASWTTKLNLISVRPNLKFCTLLVELFLEVPTTFFLVEGFKGILCWS